MVRRLAMGLLFLSLLTVIGCESDLPEGAIAQVGVTLISQEQFDELKAAHEATGRAPDKDKHPDEYRSFERGLVEYLVTLEVLRQEAPELDVRVTDRDVRNEVEKLKQMFQGDEEKFQAALETMGLTEERLMQSIEEDLLLARMKAAVTEDVSISDEEATTYYETHEDEYVTQESRNVRHILISPFVTANGRVSTTASQGEWEAARKEAEKVRSEILNGADFITEAEKYSDDETTRESGGDLGAVTRGMLVPAFEEAVFALQIGDLSEPVKSPYGYHLIEVTDVTPEQQLAYDQVMENIKSALLEEKQTKTWEQWLAATQAKLGVVYTSGYEPNSKDGDTTAASPSDSKTE